jgi:ABC-type branched-subunit amino acid transport system substrate-binding protein
MVRNRFRRAAAVACVLALTAAACGGDDEETGEATAAAEEPTAEEPTAEESAEPAEESAEPAATTAAPEESSAPAEESSAPAEESSAPAEEGGLPAGLWNDGPCDAALPTLKIGLQTVFASGVLTLGDQAVALEASAAAFNERGGANGACIEVITCDDGADPNKAVECVRTLDEAGVVATVNDTTPVAGTDVAAAYAAAGIPRFAISPGQDDYPDLNSYPFTAGGTGVSIMMPQALLDAGVTKIAITRVDIPSATALAGFYQAVFTDNGLEVVADLPVPAGTTDYSQFILAAQAAGAEGIAMPIGGQEGIQVLRAGQQLDADLLYSSSTGTFPLSDILSLGEYGERVILNEGFPPAAVDNPVINQIVADLEANSDEELLQRPNLKASPMRSWIGLYALLQILRADGGTEFTREGVKALIDASGPIDMLGITPDWTPATDHEGAFTRAGSGYYSFWKIDAANETFVLASEADWDTVICGSPIGGPCA